MTTIEAVPATPSDVPPQSAIQQPVQPLAAASPQTYAVVLRDPLQSNTAPAKPPRLVSLDVFRGMTIAAMVLVNTMPGEHKWWALVHADEQGAHWNGWTPTDLIFPFFLFIVGVATPFSLGKRAGKDSRGNLLAHIWARAIALFALGEVLTGLPYTNFSAIPPGHEGIKILRLTLAGLCLLGVLLLLIPWPSKKLTLWLPPVILVLFYVTAFVCHHIIQGASGLPEHFSFGNGLLNPLHLRIPGVLQRIGICYGIAATIGLYFDWRMVLLWAIALMTIYTGIVFNVPFKPSSEVTIPYAPPSTAKVTGVLTRQDNLGRRIDEWLLIKPQLDASGKPIMNDGEPVNRWNHAYGYPDNEGMLSTIPAIAEVLLGILAGVWLRTFRPAAERGMGLLVFGLFTLLLGMALNKWLMPINKLTWSPSFTIFTSGMALLVLGTVFFFVDVLGRRAWALPFKIYGMNAIAAFCIYGLLGKLLTVIKLDPNKYHADNALGWWEHQVFHGVESFSNAMQHLSPKFAFIGWEPNQSLAYSISYVLVVLVLMSLLYVCKIFVKV